MNDPTSVKCELIAEFYKAMGFDPAGFNNVQRIEIDPHGVRIHVIRVLRNEKGHAFAVGNSVARETTDVRIDYTTYKSSQESENA